MSEPTEPTTKASGALGARVAVQHARRVHAVVHHVEAARVGAVGAEAVEHRVAHADDRRREVQPSPRAVGTGLRQVHVVEHGHPARARDRHEGPHRRRVVDVHEADVVLA